MEALAYIRKGMAGKAVLSLACCGVAWCWSLWLVEALMQAMHKPHNQMLSIWSLCYELWGP